MSHVPPPTPVEPPPGIWARWAPTRLLLFSFMLLFGNVFIQIAVFGATGTMSLAILAGNLLGIILPCALASSSHESSLSRDFHLRWPGTGGVVLAGLAAVAALVPSSFLANLSARLHDIDPDWIEYFREMLPDSTVGIILTAVTVTAAVPVAEELLFRGLVYRLARRSWGPWPAALVSSLAFGLVHLEPWNLFGLVGLGLWLAFLYETTGSLVAPVVAHATHNGISLYLMTNERASLEEPQAITGNDFVLLAGSLALAAAVAVALRRRGRTGSV